MPSETKQSKRLYAQLCPLARALDAVGERWTLLIVRNLLVGPQRYSELLETLPGMTTNLLAKRLKELTARGLLEPIEAHGVTFYQLTCRGRALEDALMALSAWGDAEPVPVGGHRNLRWAMLGIRRRYLGGLNLRLRICASDTAQEFLLQLGHSRVEFLPTLERGQDLLLQGKQSALFSLLYKKAVVESQLRSGAVSLDGSRDELTMFLQSLGD